jgi:hypothetical protein
MTASKARKSHRAKELHLKFKWFAIATALTFVCALPRSSSARSSDDQITDDYLDRLNEWVLYVDASSLKDCVDYRGSTLNPMTNVHVVFRLIQKPYRPKIDPSPQPYEDLWYHNGTPVGCRRHRQLAAGNNALGVIVVRDSAEVAQHTEAIANAIARLMVELYENERPCTAVIVPLSIYNRLGDDLSQCRFYKKAQPKDLYRQVHIHMLSNPRKLDNWFFFELG